MSGPIEKSDLNSGVSKYRGSVKTYTLKSGTSILAGQPVCLDMAANGAITCKPCDSSTIAETILGISTSTKTSGSVTVMTNGYITARRTSVANTGDKTVLMEDDVYDTIHTLDIGQTVTFKDPRADNEYQTYDKGSVIFDAGAGNTIRLVFNSFKFESDTSRHYDRLSIRTSNDKSSWTDIQVPWMQKMLSGTYADDYGTGFGGSSWNSSGSRNGNVLPATESRAILLGMPTLPTDLLLPTRYVRFEFYADSGTNDDGWNISLFRSPLGTTGNLPGTISQRLYLDTGDFTKVKDTGVISLGYIAATDADNDSIYMRSLDFSVFDGATGPTGPVGPPGVKGDAGSDGIKGDQGVAGSDGIKGDQGIQGVKGDSGVDGKDGQAVSGLLNGKSQGNLISVIFNSDTRSLVYEFEAGQVMVNEVMIGGGK